MVSECGKLGVVRSFLIAVAAKMWAQSDFATVSPPPAQFNSEIQSLRPFMMRSP
jgi:hypothetical protein